MPLRTSSVVSLVLTIPLLALGAPPPSKVEVTNTTANPVPTQVTNTSADPVPTQITNPVVTTRAAPTAGWNEAINIAVPAGSHGNLFTLPAPPPGKQYVVEFVSARLAIPLGQQLEFSIHVNGMSYPYHLLATRQYTHPAAFDVFVVGQSLVLRSADVIHVGVNRDQTSGSLSGWAVFAGHLEDAPPTAPAP